MIRETASRLYRTVAPAGWRAWGEKLVRFPRGSVETKAHSRSRSQADAGEFLRFLRREGSVARRAFTELLLTREISQKVWAGMRFGRAAQVTMTIIVCASWFKYFDKRGDLLPVLCALCGEEDSFEHLFRCVGARPSARDPSEHVEFLRGLALRACRRQLPHAPRLI